MIDAVRQRQPRSLRENKKVSGPPINENPLHARLAEIAGKLRKHDDVVVGALADALGCHRTALFVKKLIYWLSPSNKAPERPRATVYRQNKADALRDPDDLSTYGYWVCRSRKEWSVMGLDRWKLERVYAVCGDLVERGYFLFAGQRRTHYRIDFAKLLNIFEQDERAQAVLANPSISSRKDLPPVGGARDDEDESKHLKERFMQMKKRLDKTSDRSEVDERSQKLRFTEANEDELPPPPARRLNNTLDETKSIHQTLTGCAGACACAPSATGAAAPEPPPPARRSTLDSVETAPAKPEVTSFKQAQAILGAAEGAPTKEKLKRVVPYGEHTRLALGYLLIWQGEYERIEEKYQFTEAHYLQSVEFAEEEEVPLGDFYGTLRAAWNTVPREGFDPCFMSSRHSKKLTTVFRWFRRMEKELLSVQNRG